MQVKNVLILAAGKGTRMGGIGKELPKLLWPVFDKTLLELQIDYARKLAPNASIYINTYYYSEKVKNFFFKNNLEKICHLIVEEEVLDIGGAIHNLASKLDYEGALLVLNGDQFLMFEEGFLAVMAQEIQDKTALLLGYEVNSDQGYNALSVDENSHFGGVVPNQNIERNTKMMTYTGTSLLNLSKLNKNEGKSKFFDSVALPGSATGVYNLNNFEYWDFGTLERYYNSHTHLLSSQESRFFKFLLEHNALDQAKIMNEVSYGVDEGIKVGDMLLRDGKVHYRDFSEKIVSS